MKNKLSKTSQYKETIRKAWCQYILKILDEKEVDNEFSEYIDFKMITFIEEKLVDVKLYLELENFELENLICVSNQVLPCNNYKDFLDRYSGLLIHPFRFY